MAVIVAAACAAAALAVPLAPPQPRLPAGFDAVFPGRRVFGPQVELSPTATTPDMCAAACVAKGDHGCIAFTWVGGSDSHGTAGIRGGACELSGWGPEFLVLPNTTSIYFARYMLTRLTGGCILAESSMPRRQSNSLRVHVDLDGAASVVQGPTEA